MGKKTADFHSEVNFRLGEGIELSDLNSAVLIVVIQLKT